MQPWDSREGAPSEVRTALAELAARDIPTPTAVEEAVAVLRRVEAAEPEQVDAQAIRQAFLRGADQDEIDRLLVADLGAVRLRSEWSQARISAAAGVLTALRESADEIFPKLRAQAEQAIGRLQAVADLGPSATLDNLIRSGDTDSARLLADVAQHAAELDACFALRDRYLVKGGAKSLTVNGIDASRWVDPIEAARHARGASPAEQYVSALRSDCTLWFPSAAEARAAAQAFADAAAAEAERKRKAEFGIGASFESW